MNDQFNDLTPAESERLYLLAEECGEVVQAVTKILRHGYASAHPDGGPTNRESLAKEVGDVLVAIEMLKARMDISECDIELYYDDKQKTVKQYLHHQPE